MRYYIVCTKILRRFICDNVSVISLENNSLWLSVLVTGWNVIVSVNALLGWRMCHCEWYERSLQLGIVNRNVFVDEWNKRIVKFQ